MKVKQNQRGKQDGTQNNMRGGSCMQLARFVTSSMRMQGFTPEICNKGVRVKICAR